jgi:LemA protein
MVSSIRMVHNAHRIAVEGHRYNETLQDYNTYLSRFPNNIIASLSGFSWNDAYFKMEEGARQAPKVNFDRQQVPSPAPAKP